MAVPDLSPTPDNIHFIRRKRKMQEIAGERRGRGRPKIGEELEYKSKYEQILKAFEKGKAKIYVAAKILKCSKQSLYAAMARDPELKAIIEKGEALSEQWWTEQGQKNLATKGFNCHLYSFMMTNIHKWNTNKSQVNAQIEADVKNEVNLPQLTNEMLDKLVDNA